MSELPNLIAGLFLAALALSSARLIAQAVRTPIPGFRRPRAWRVATLIAMQALSATLLWLTLFPPTQTLPAVELTVFTAGADAIATGSAVALPEAPDSIHAERVPDLATALRRHGNISRLRIVGQGLTARDREAAHGLDLQFAPSAEPLGLIELEPPQWPRAGQNWQLRGRVHGNADTHAELRAPDDSVIDRAAIDADGRFVLNARARGPGQALFQLRLLDAENQVRVTHAVPVATRAGDPLRVALRAGGTNAELKYLRRWMRDAGLQLGSDLSLSPEVTLRDQAPELTADTLANIDVLLLDDRAWYGLGRIERESVLSAARNGLGVLVLLGGEPDRSQRQQLAALGFAVNAADLSRTVRLADRRNANATDTTANTDADRPPELSRRPLRVTADASQPLLRADDGEALALWHPMGRGRVALWWLTDSFRLVLSGASSEHANLWRDALSLLARPRATPAPRITPDYPPTGTRITICADAKMRVQSVDAEPVTLLPQIDRNGQHCAGFWPRHAGWHTLQTASGEWPFYVRERNELTAMQAWRDRQLTAQLATFAGKSQPPQASATTRASPFPYALAWLLSLALLWVFERLLVGH